MSEQSPRDRLHSLRLLLGDQLPTDARPEDLPSSRVDGALVLLSALERNAREGSPGRLISFDSDPFSGWVVPERLRGNWQPVFASTFDVLESTLAGEQVDLFVCDTPPEYEIESFEMACAVRHAGERQVLISGGGDRNPALPEVLAEADDEYHYFKERPRHPVYPGAAVGLALRGYER